MGIDYSVLTMTCVNCIRNISAREIEFIMHVRVRLYLNVRVSRRMRESWQLCCPERATFPIPFSQCTCSTCVYRSFVSDLVPAKFVTVNKNIEANSIVSEQASTSHILRGHVAIITNRLPIMCMY